MEFIFPAAMNQQEAVSRCIKEGDTRGNTASHTSGINPLNITFVRNSVFPFALRLTKDDLLGLIAPGGSSLWMLNHISSLRRRREVILKKYYTSARHDL